MRSLESVPSQQRKIACTLLAFILGMGRVLSRALGIACLFVAALSIAADQNRNLVVAPSPGARVALVIGNSAYPGAGMLRNPVNDAIDIAAKLRKLNFQVTLKTNVPLRDMLRALTEFGDKVQPGSEVLFFYAGHGMQVRGKNYLIPIDAEIKTENAVSSEAVDVDQLLDKLASARLSMVILDACRNNPFERRFRGGGQGLASINAPTGTLIAYATAPGRVASDGDGRNGLYTKELLSAMDAPGVTVENVFKRVRTNVIKQSGEAQTPWESSSLTGDFYFRPPTISNTQPVGVLPTQPDDQQAVELAFWESIKNSADAEDFQAYLDKYPTGQFVALAERRAKKKSGKTTDAAAISETAQPEATELGITGGARGLEWADADNGADINWNEATQYCASKGSGWRLPTVAELQASYQSGHSTPCGSHVCKASSKSRLTGPVFWSNESNGYSEAWVLGLYNDDRQANPVGVRSLRRALCVRRY